MAGGTRSWWCQFNHPRGREGPKWTTWPRTQCAIHPLSLVVAGLTDAEIAIPSDDGWTIGAQLAHLAFWDRVHGGRLRELLGSGGDLPGSFPPGAVDEINNAGLEAWRRFCTAAIRWFAEASSEVDAYLASLDPSVVDRIRSAGLPRLVERYRHRTDHGAAIEQALQFAGDTRRGWSSRWVNDRRVRPDEDGHGPGDVVTLEVRVSVRWPDEARVRPLLTRHAVRARLLFPSGVVRSNALE